MAQEKAVNLKLVNVWEFPFVIKGFPVEPGKSFSTTDKFLANELIASNKAVFEEDYKPVAKEAKK